MKLSERLQSVPPGQWLMLGDCPRIHHMMSGIERAGISAAGEVRAVYGDGEEKSAPAEPWFLELDESKVTLLAVASNLTP